MGLLGSKGVAPILSGGSPAGAPMSLLLLLTGGGARRQSRSTARLTLRILEFALAAIQVNLTATTRAREPAACDCSTKELCEQCSVEHAVREMQTQKKGIVVQTNVCAKLGKLDVQLPSDIEHMQAIVKGVTGVMTQFPGDQSSRKYKQLADIPSYDKLLMLHTNCCAALGQLSGKGMQGQIAVDADGVTLVVAAMLAFPHDEELQINALLALGNSIQGNADAQNEAYDVGGLHATLAAMLQFSSSHKLHANACFALAGMAAASGDEDTRYKRQRALLVEDGLAILVGAMHKHDKKWMVQEFCCMALYELVGGVRSVHADHSAAVIAAGALESAGAASRRHRNARKCAKLADKIGTAKDEL